MRSAGKAAGALLLREASAAVRNSATAGVNNGTVPAEATRLVMMPVG